MTRREEKMLKIVRHASKRADEQNVNLEPRRIIILAQAVCHRSEEVFRMKSISALKSCAVMILMVSGLLSPIAYAGKARTQSAPGVDLTQYKTYQWLPTRVLR